jgi:hypothetical protein
MDAVRGYRLKTATITELSGLIDGYRREAMKILARDYARLVARRAVAELDLSLAGGGHRRQDMIGWASSEVAAQLAKKDFVLNGRDLNCRIQFDVVREAVLARFLSGNAEYLRLWEGRKDVVKWHWERGLRPQGVTEKNWESRRRFWIEATKKPSIGAGFKFILIDEQLPSLGWNGIHRYVPDYESRVATCVDRMAQAQGGASALKKAELEKIRQKVRATIPERPAKEHFSDRTAPVAAPRQHAAVKVEAVKPHVASLTERGPAKRSMIDHADVVVSGDGRTFVAVPNVGLDPEARVFVQVSEKDVSISQGGVQFGTVTNVPRAAVDHLRMCDTVTLVEVEHADGRRLLRARHVAIVKDISMFETAMRPLVGFVRNKTPGRGSEEIREWNSTK